MAINTKPIVPRDGSITVADATGSPITSTITYEDGDFSVSGLKPGQKDHQMFLDRGTMYAARYTDESPVSFSFSAHATHISDATEKTFMDSFLKLGAFAAGVSQFGSDTDEVWAVKVTFTAEQTNSGAAVDGSVTLTYCVGECSFEEGTPGKFSVSGSAYLVSSAGIALAG